jgi:hypothetical protein
MKKTAALLSALLFVSLPFGAAQAKGCIKGALVGGVAGHYVGHHGVLGAIAGCLYGRHEANKQRHMHQQPYYGSARSNHARAWTAGA